MQETWVRSLGWEDPLEEGMATHSSVLAWRSPWTEEPGGLQSMGLQESDTTEQQRTAQSQLGLPSPWSWVSLGLLIWEKNPGVEDQAALGRGAKWATSPGPPEVLPTLPFTPALPTLLS